MSSSGLISMYKLKPLIEPPGDIRVKCDMYKLKVINDDRLIALEKPKQQLVKPAGLENDEKDIIAIEARQKVLLGKIEEMKKMLVAIKTALAQPPKIERPDCKMAVEIPDISKLYITHDVVLNINPMFPLYSLLGIKHVWPGLNVNYSWHVHCSITSLPENAVAFQNMLSSQTQKGSSQLNVRIIWKNVGNDCEFIVTPAKGVLMHGEVTFLRFLNSCTTPKEPVLQVVTDEIFDACHALNHCRSTKDTQLHLQTIAEGLENYHRLVGESLYITDIAVWSVLKRTKKHSLPAALSKQFEACDKMLNL